MADMYTRAKGGVAVTVRRMPYIILPVILLLLYISESFTPAELAPYSMLIIDVCSCAAILLLTLVFVGEMAPQAGPEHTDE